MDTEQKFYRIWGNEISERSAIWLDTHQLADMQAQGYECEPITGELTEASLATMHQLYGLATYATGVGQVSHYQLIRGEKGKVVMLVENAVSWITKRRGRVDTDASDTA